MYEGRFRVRPDGFRLADRPTDETGDHDKKSAQKKLEADVEELSALQDRFYAHDRYALLVVIQAMDAAGKDGTIKHVLSGLNPSGCEVSVFKSPSAEELDHDFLWRCMKRMPERGRIGIFNRSYYEEVLVVRVRPEILRAQKLPTEKVTEGIWQERFADINHVEHYLWRNGTRILKFFLHVSKEEQRKRLLDRARDPDKNWKLSLADVKEREHWDAYQIAYEDALRSTSTDWAPWYVVPADTKWFARLAVADILVSALREIDPRYPEPSPSQKADVVRIREILERG